MPNHHNSLTFAGYVEKATADALGARSVVQKEVFDRFTFRESVRSNTVANFFSRPVSFGEVFPRFLGDVTEVRTSFDDDVWLGWTALYAYTVAIDGAMDRDEKIVPQHLLTLTALFEYSLYKLRSAVRQQRDHKRFHRYLKEALDCQYRSSGQHFGPEVTYETARGKNRLLSAYSLAYACRYRLNKGLLVQIADALLLPIQLCDDLVDVYEDYVQRVPTLLTQHFLKDQCDRARILTKHELYEGLISNGDLTKHIRQICSGLRSAQNVLLSGKDLSRNVEILGVIDMFVATVTELERYLSEIRLEFQTYSVPKRHAIIDHVESVIRAQAPSS